MLGHGDGVGRRALFHDQDASRGGGVEVHVIDAHAGAADDAQFGRLLEHLASDLDGATDDQGGRPRVMV